MTMYESALSEQSGRLIGTGSDLTNSLGDIRATAFSLRLPLVTVQQLVLAPRRPRGDWIVRLLAVRSGRRSQSVIDQVSDVARFFGEPERKIHVIRFFGSERGVMGG